MRDSGRHFGNGRSKMKRIKRDTIFELKISAVIELVLMHLHEGLPKDAEAAFIPRFGEIPVEILPNLMAHFVLAFEAYGDDIAAYRYGRAVGRLDTL